MKETTIQIKTELEKINAIRIYTNGKGNDIEQELTDYVDTLYRKYVPPAVREFIEKADEQEQASNRRQARRKPASDASPGNETENGGTE